MSDLPIMGFRCWKIGIDTTYGDSTSTRLHDQSEIQNVKVVGAPYLTSYYPTVAKATAVRWQRITDAATSSRCGKAVSHRAAADDCSCGLYAYHDLLSAVEELRTYYGARHHHPWVAEFVLGAVVGTGHVLVHNRGWRAGRARIVALSDIGPAFSEWPQYHGRKVAEQLGVPVIPHRHLERYAAEHGQRMSKVNFEEGPEVRLAA